MNDTRRPILEETLPPLEPGDRLDQKTLVLRQGLATPEHAAFVARLAAGTGPSNP